MKVGLIGLPSCGKTTVFNAITGVGREVGGYSAGPSLDLATVHVPDERLDEIARIISPKKSTPASLDWVDVTGLVSGEGRTEIDAAVLGKVRELDGLGMVLRAFESDSVAHPKGSVDPVRDLDLIRTELVFADLAVAEGRRERLSKDLERGRTPKEEGAREVELLEKVIGVLEDGRAARELEFDPDEEKPLRGFQFLTRKPEVIIVNTGDDGSPSCGGALPPHSVGVNGALEMELGELDEPERSEFAREMGVAEPAAETVTRAAYRAMGVMTFYTTASGDLRAWTLPAGATALDAAGAVHTDMQRGFIRAEVVSHEGLVGAGSAAEAKAKGLFRPEGRDYRVADGDIITIRFSS